MTNKSPYHPTNFSATCPECGKLGTFDFHSSSQDIRCDFIDSNTIGWIFTSGMRFCPDQQCNAPLFFLKKQKRVGNQIELFSNELFPKSTIDFDNEAIPNEIVETFREALICHSNNCYRAAGAMIRRTLEEICSDRECKGQSLHQKLKQLQSKVIIPQELLDAAFNLKLLGNDAAHVEAKTYEQIGEQEIILGIELTKELLKSVYQYKWLVEKLKKYQKN